MGMFRIGSGKDTTCHGFQSFLKGTKNYELIVGASYAPIPDSIQPRVVTHP